MAERLNLSYMINYNKNNLKIARTLRKNLTPWERKLWYDFLRNYPVRFQRQKLIADYICDFYCAKASLVIELDGGGHYEDKQIISDKIRTDEIEKLGLKVVRFCNIDLDKNFYEVCQKIDETVKERIELLGRNTD
ncbi:MAG: endonuclease domain-containing protein [Clostridia bacterium]|nr:endonuclease domain-containing protein [Clostridia bacterium]